MAPRSLEHPLRRTFLVASLVCAPGCFADSPFVTSGGDGPNGTDGGSSDGDSTAGDPTTTADATAASGSASQGSAGTGAQDSGSEGTDVGVCGDAVVDDGEPCDDGNDVPGDGCEFDCTPSSGLPYWTVIDEGEGSRGGAYVVIAATDGDVVVGGARGSSATTSDPWVARYDADGGVRWSDAMAAGEGNDVIRGLAAIDDGVVAVGAFDPVVGQHHGLVRVFDDDGAMLWSDDYWYEPTQVVLLGVAGREAGGWFAAGTAIEDATSTSALLRYDGQADWSRAVSTVEDGSFEGHFGTIFAIVEDPTGRALAVGSDYTSGNGIGHTQAWAALLQPDGSVLRESYFGGEGDDDLVDVVLMGNTAYAVGRLGGFGESSQAWLVRLQVDDMIQVSWQATWSDASFTVANGLATNGSTHYVAAATSPGGTPEGYDARILRWEDGADVPTWVVPFEDDAPGSDFASDVAIASDGTVVAVGAVTPAGTSDRRAWVRKLAP